MSKVRRGFSPRCRNQGRTLTCMKAQERGSEPVLDEIWTAQDVAAYWRVTDRMVTGMAMRREIPGAFRVGNRWRFRSATIRSIGKVPVSAD